MDLGTAPLFDLTATRADEAVKPAVPTRSEALLAGIRDDQQAITDREIAKLRKVAEWASENVVADEGDVATLTERGLDTGLPVAGPGAPLISDFAVMELAHRLPKTWARVLDGEVPVWKALRIADSTRLLPLDAAAFVDAQLAPFAHGCTWTQIDRLVETALVRFDPEAAGERRRIAQDHRHVDTGLDQVGYDGTAHLSGTLDAADALDLEQAIARRAKLYGQLGDEDSLDVRRAKALGEIAREDLALDLDVADPDTGEITRTVPGRKTELIVHVSATDQTVGRFGNTRTPISVEQIRTWLTLPNTSVIVRPVLDLNGSQPVDSYEISDRIRRQVELRDHHCGFPCCTRPVERCDLDHIEPHAAGGETSAHNLCPGGRGHHRMKTAGRAQYRMLTPGTYYWTLPSGTYLVDPTGTYQLTATQPPDE